MIMLSCGALVLQASLFALFAILVLTWLSCGKRILGRSLRISRIRLQRWAISIDGIIYDYAGSGPADPDRRFTIDRLTLRPRLPRPSSPRFASVGFDNITLTDPHHECHVSGTSLTLWAFPSAFGSTAGSWASLNMSGLRLIVYSSRSTPDWVIASRKNVVFALLTGEVLRCDYFRTSARLQPLPGLDDGGRLDKPPDQDEATVHTACERVHLLSAEQSRMYTWESLAAGLREDWVEGRGFLKIAAKGAKWVRLNKHGEPRDQSLSSVAISWLCRSSADREPIQIPLPILLGAS
jgi:hypothetical protein